jgi:indolepyruvate decarboxylase
MSNNDGYMVERALEPNPDWSYNDLANGAYADLPRRSDARTG